MRIPTCVALLGLLGCSASQEAATIPRDVRVDGAGLTEITTDLGYTVRLTRARAVIDGLAFTRATMVAQRSPLRWLIGTAHAHPGHDGAGDLVGDLPGRFVLDWTAPATLGTAQLLDGGFNGARLLLVNGTAADGLAEGDPLIGHAVVLAGTAEKDGATVEFSVAITLDEPTLVEGIPRLDGADTRPIHGVRLVTRDPFEDDTMFDGIDFANADLEPGGADYNRVLRAIRSHDHYLISGDEE